jgi:hypothetical protein
MSPLVQLRSCNTNNDFTLLETRGVNCKNENQNFVEQKCTRFKIEQKKFKTKQFLSENLKFYRNSFKIKQIFVQLKKNRLLFFTEIF